MAENTNKKNMTLEDFDELIDKRSTRMESACNAYLDSHECAFITNADDVKHAHLVKLTTNLSWEEDGATDWATLKGVTLSYQYNEWSKVKSRSWDLSREDCKLLVSKLQGILDAADKLDEHITKIREQQTAESKAA